MEVDLEDDSQCASKEQSNVTEDDDELLLLSSPTSSPNNSTVSNTKNKSHKKNTSEVIEILDQTLPDASISASESSEEESLGGEAQLVEESSFCTDGKINIFHCHGSFLVWNAEDVQMLREECRIVGKLIGCLPRAPRQNVQLGLPLQLMPEEAKLLVEIDAACVVVESPFTKSQQEVRKAAFENVRQQNFQIQQNLYKQHRKEEVSKRMSSIIAGKKAKKRKLKEEKKSGDDPKTNVDEKEINLPKSKTTSPDNLEESSKLEGTEGNKESESDSKSSKAASSKKGEETSGENTTKEEDEAGDQDDDKDVDSLTVEDIINTETSEQHALVQVFTESPWKQSVEAYRGWTYPSSDQEWLRYRVFKDLWGKGFYLTSGSKFGGDFLVYPGDPARYHSHYIAVCRNQFDEAPCLDFVTLGRLASNVRKTALLCSLDRSRTVTYTSLTWTGIS